jgi:hypothetical protein
MQPLSQTAARSHDYRAVVPLDGYVHKFRLEAREEAAAPDIPSAATPTVNLGALVGKFALSLLALIGLAAAGAHALI